MIRSTELTLTVDGSPMKMYLAQPADLDSKPQCPAVIVLEGVYGFDDEMKRITDLVASVGLVGLAINYFHRSDPDFKNKFDDAGRAKGEAATRNITKASVRADVSAARDWLNDQPFVSRGHIGTWGFGFGGTMAFVTATLAGINAAVAFYGQSLVSLMPDGEASPLDDAKDVRAPLLLVFGGKDELISSRDVQLISTGLTSNNKKFDLQMYPNVGHSFFRATQGTTSAREAADAWDRVQSFYGKYLV